MNITSGKKNKGYKIVIYGSEGIGKTTLASKFPEPLFLDVEGSTDHYEDMNRIEPDEGKSADWNFIMNTCKEILSDPSVCKTLIIDSGDWAETLCVKNVCKANGKNGIEDFGYGKGYTYLQETYQKFLNALSLIVEKGINVIITAHAKMVKIELPEQDGAYDRWQFKLTKQVSPIVKEWADMILFCNYETEVVNVDDKTKKGKGKGTDKRVMYTTHSAVWDAKNRDGLAPKLDLDYSEIAHLFESNTKPKKKSTPKKEEPAPTEDDIFDNPEVEAEPTVEDTPLEEAINPPVEEEDDFDLFADEEPASDYPDDLMGEIRKLITKADEEKKLKATEIIKPFGTIKDCEEDALRKVYDILSKE